MRHNTQIATNCDVRFIFVASNIIKHSVGRRNSLSYRSKYPVGRRSTLSNRGSILSAIEILCPIEASILEAVRIFSQL